MNRKDIQISREYQQDIARKAEFHRQSAEARTPEEVIIEIKPGRIPFILIALQKLAASLTLKHDGQQPENGTPKHA